MQARTALCVLLFLPALASSGATVPPVDVIEASRSGDDLVLRWLAPPTPVDGYRVYRSAFIGDCEGPQLVYEGTATTFLDPGSFIGRRPAVYTIAAFAGPDEGPAEMAYERF